MRNFFGILFIIIAVSFFIFFITCINKGEVIIQLLGCSGTFAAIGGLLIHSARIRKEEEEEKKNFDR